MRSAIAGLAVLALAAAAAGPARAGGYDARQALRRAEALVASLFRAAPPDGEVVAPPGNIDPDMALSPPGPHGTLRIVRPPAARQ